MTYTFKLSTRLALLRAAALTLIGLSASCVDGDLATLSPYARVAGTAVALDRQSIGATSKRPGRRIEVLPDSVILVAGDSVGFSLKSAYKTGGVIAWSATGGVVGSNGNYIAGAMPGTYIVVALDTQNVVADTARVIVTPAGIARRIAKIAVLPAAASLAIGNDTQYTVAATYDDGTTQAVHAEFRSNGGTFNADRFTAGNTPGTFEVVATVGYDTSRTTVVVQAPANTAAQRTADPISLQAGYQPIAAFTPPASTPLTSSIVQLGCNTGSITGCWWRYGIGESIKFDTTAKMGSNVLELTFPKGLEPGWGDDQFGGWTATPTQYREVTESAWFKIPSPDFETQLVGVKLWGYWGVGGVTPSDNPTQLYMILSGNGVSTSVMSSWNIWFGQQGSIHRRLDQNLTSAKLVKANTWHHYTLYMKVNDLGAINGILKVSIDGVPVMAYSDVEYRTAANPVGFFGRKWHPIWGGSGGTAKTRTDHLWVNSISISGVPM